MSVALVGHRGCRGLRPENTLAGFEHAARLGVSGVELDVGVSRDGAVVVTHDPRLAPLICRDTAPAEPGDPDFPYVGKLVRDLTLAQLRTLDCGSRWPADPAVDPFRATQQPVPGARMPTLAEVLSLLRSLGDDRLVVDIEIKSDPTADEVVGPQELARRVVDVVGEHGVGSRCLVSSFDWRVLVAARERAPSLARSALAAASTVFPGTPWTAGAPVRDARPFDGEVVDLAAALDAGRISVAARDLTDPLVERAHGLGLGVAVWTVNEPAEMASLLDRGVDALITDHPDRARRAFAAAGVPLPEPLGPDRPTTAA